MNRINQSSNTDVCLAEQVQSCPNYTDGTDI